MSPQSRLERYEQRTEWPLVAVALTFVQRVADEDTANQAATAAQISELREEIGRLAESVEAEGVGRQRGRVEGSG